MIENLILLIVVIVIFIALFNNLGRRTGHEKKRTNVYDFNNKKHESIDIHNEKTILEAPITNEKENKITKNSLLEDQIAKISKFDNDFSVNTFCDGTKIAYEMVLIAYSEEDYNVLNNLLREDVKITFTDAIERRKSKNELLEYTLIRVLSSEILSIELRSSIAQITVKLVGEIGSLLKHEAVNENNLDKIQEYKKTEVWIFEKDMKSKNPNWKVIDIKSSH
ncbi:Tim44/TimA family putative adaptor protein [Hyphomicrobiales bacterium]|jgi:predicted lipid-binding transport protein (Tim44 family)|nr:Tim44/TimA family putative adaptor protein [Hyphomicrobiales bacterium]|tara:strand:- start:5234 stop:5899 length:666 start_codon:yes stop_codon:yes gene_type:complete